MLCRLCWDCVACFQVSMVKRRSCGSCSTWLLWSGSIWQQLKLLNILLDPHSSLLFYNLHISVFLYRLWFFVDLFCTCDFCCIRPVRGILPLFLFLFFLFLLLKGIFGVFFLSELGLQTEGFVCCRDCTAPWSKFWFVILGCIKKADLAIKAMSKNKSEWDDMTLDAKNLAKAKPWPWLTWEVVQGTWHDRW